VERCGNGKDMMKKMMKRVWGGMKVRGEFVKGLYVT